MYLNLLFLVSAAALAILGAGLYSIIVYNALVSQRNQCDRAWANIDVLLKQRFDEVPSLVAVCKGYMRYEQETLRAVTQAQAAWLQAQSLQEKLGAGLQASQSLRQLFCLAEQYPQLHGDQSFLRLQQRITELECQIADRREFYNDCVNTYNNRIDQFPEVWISRLFTFSPAPLFEGARDQAAVEAV